jgi:hypothetical protein
LLETSVRSWAIRAGGTATNTFDIADLTAGQTRLTLDSSGNLGLGVTPSAWNSSQWSVFEGAYGGALAFYKASNVPVTVLTSNAYNDGSWKYKTTDPALQYEMDGNVGIHKWYNAASGTAGNAISFTQAATLDADGNFMVGVTSSSFRMSAVVASGANRDIFGAQISGVSNGFTIKWNHATTTTRVNIANLPTSSAGLASGDLWNDGGTLKVA